MSINTCTPVALAPNVMTDRSLFQSFISRSSAQNITLQITKTGFMFSRGKQLIAWIVCGYHKGQYQNEPKTCQFVDLAYFRSTQKGQNLETLDVDNLEAAFQFLLDTFGVNGASI